MILKTMHKALHLRDDVDRLNETKKEAEDWNLCICNNPETQRIYKQKQRELDYSSQ